MKKVSFMGKIAAVFMTVILFVCIGCSTTPVGLTSAITPLDDKIITENLGKVEGRDSTFSVFGLFMVGTPDIARAVDKAIRAKDGDTLINVRCYEVYRYYILLSTTTVVVQGDAVKVTKAANKNTNTNKGRK